MYIFTDVQMDGAYPVEWNAMVSILVLILAMRKTAIVITRVADEFKCPGHNFCIPSVMVRF